MLDRIGSYSSDESSDLPRRTLGAEIALKTRSAKDGERWWWLNVLLLLITLLSTTVFGYALQLSFSEGRPLYDEAWIRSYRILLSGDRALLSGLSYSIPLILILLSHELGHYVVCRKRGITATLPFFGPSPTLLGTIGAFIWIRSPIYQRRSLFDVGIWGPIAGFLALIPSLIAGVYQSKVCHGGTQQSFYVFGTPLLLRFVELLRFPGTAAQDICLHPTAMAAWAGLLATSINLLPVGQLDGGHIIYAGLGERGHAYVSWAVIGGLLLGGFLYPPWWILAIAMFRFRRHPLVYDTEPLGRNRQFATFAALLLLLASLSILPVRQG